MKEIPLENLKAGTVLKDHLYYDDYFIALPKYHTITQDDIKMVEGCNLSPIYSSFELETVEEKPEVQLEQKVPLEPKVPKEPLVLTEPKEPHMTEPPEEEKVKPPYETIISLLSSIFVQIKEGVQVKLENIHKIASSCIEYSQNKKEDALLRISRGMHDLRLEAHSLNTGILCTLLASDAGIKGNDLVNTVAGALLHDAGLLLLNEDEKNRNIIKHTIYGFQYLKVIKDAHPFMVLPSLQHHEKGDGSGYPKKMLLKNINTSARLVAICDSCDTHVSYLRYGNDLSLHITKDELFSWKKEDFDQALFDRFNIILSSVFKSGRQVALSDDSIGVVKKTSVRFPLTPVVEIITDSIGVGLEDPVLIELVKSKDFFIKKFL